MKHSLGGESRLIGGLLRQGKSPVPPKEDDLRSFELRFREAGLVLWLGG